MKCERQSSRMEDMLVSDLVLTQCFNKYLSLPVSPVLRIPIPTGWATPMLKTVRPHKGWVHSYVCTDVVFSDISFSSSL